MDGVEGTLAAASPGPCGCHGPKGAVERLIAARRPLVEGLPIPRRKESGEGGCGVLGVIAAEPIAGRYLVRPMLQMCNRGNGKGGGVAAAGLVPEQVGVPREVLRSDYLIQVAYLDAGARAEVEREFLDEPYHVDLAYAIETRPPDPERPFQVEPPLVWRYFARPRAQALARFAGEHGLEDLPPETIADEYVYQASYRLNRAAYDALGEKRAFVLSHGVDLAVFKAVGFAEQVLRHYRLDELEAKVWIGHQRYPTKGRVWHPGGAHPFCGLHEALVHNGDFANYASMCQYLAQRNLRPLYLTDTEVAALLFDLYSRTFDYPLEAVLEAMAPTTERDFEMLPDSRRELYRRIQAAHVKGSPDGPWFFVVARDARPSGRLELLGITDTSMLRPQVFALHGGERPIGAIASERQAIDALLQGLAEDDPGVCPVADRVWVARGGSHTDGGAFVFSVDPDRPEAGVRCADKFGVAVELPAPEAPARPVAVLARNSPAMAERVEALLAAGAADGDAAADPGAAGAALAAWALGELPGWDHGELDGFLARVERGAGGSFASAVEALRRILDHGPAAPELRANWTRSRIQAALEGLLDGVPPLGGADGGGWRRITRASASLRGPAAGESTLVLDARGFAAEGPRSLARAIVRAYEAGWRRLVVHRCLGQRFVGCGLGPATAGVQIDVYGSPGDYLGSGLDGAEVVVHGAGQDQLGQILKSGRLVVHGDVGQAFLYGAKGGEVYVRGSAAGRPLICAVGRVRAVINGTCLDYLAESFMAGDPHKDGGFVILNGVAVGAGGSFVDLPTPYPGGNLFSLASGGAVYVRDPRRLLDDGQLNGGRFEELGDADWALIRPYLEENERLFGISLERLLEVDGRPADPREVYRKVVPTRVRDLEPVAMTRHRRARA